jgi:hypothetical protein
LLAAVRRQLDDLDPAGVHAVETGVSVAFEEEDDGARLTKTCTVGGCWQRRSRLGRVMMWP